MKKRRKSKKKSRIVLKTIMFIIIIIMILLCAFCYINTMPTSSKSSEVTFKIEEGSSIRNIANTLKDSDLIRNEYFFLAYAKINKITDIKAGDYAINKNKSLKEIVTILQKGSNVKNKEVTITFKEGKNMRNIAKVIDENTSNTKDDVFNLLNDKEYINSLINEYWFLDESILNENIYYPLEGYLSPDTYNFEVNASVKDIFKKMLDQTDKVLTNEKENIDKSKFNIHQILTLASMVESEGVTLEDRKNIAGVFINRLNSNLPLGSDVTTYYAAKIDLGERDLYKSEINSNNPYNTRPMSNAGKLPVGPICNPSKEAIDAVINYTSNKYIYFVADKNMKIYFNETEAGHNKTIKELKASGLWFEY
ncbi:MAG: endolytic transglycosylase MltG [Bacilli bacterium]|nr:endolytic transglycosylase MltG [Bacilli bacterium]